MRENIKENGTEEEGVGHLEELPVCWKKRKWELARHSAGERAF